MTTRAASRHLAVATTLTVAAALAGAMGAPASAIVGGSTVPDDRYAFMASVQDAGSSGSDGHFCGGSVVASRWVLTAAHCVVDSRPGDLQVVAGRTDLEDASRGQSRVIDRVVVHPDYEDTGTFDAALLHTTAPMEVPAIPLVPQGDDRLEQDGARLTVAGWGTEFFGSPVIPSRLKSVDVEAVTDADCTTNGVMGFQPDSEICAETLGGDSCQGDSGGPLFGTLPDGRRVQVGIVSYGLGCATPGFPGVYGEVNNPSIHDFITATAGLQSAKQTGRKGGRGGSGH